MFFTTLYLYTNSAYSAYSAQVRLARYSSTLAPHRVLYDPLFVYTLRLLCLLRTGPLGPVQLHFSSKSRSLLPSTLAPHRVLYDPLFYTHSAYSAYSAQVRLARGSSTPPFLDTLRLLRLLLTGALGPVQLHFSFRLGQLHFGSTSCSLRPSIRISSPLTPLTPHRSAWPPL